MEINYKNEKYDLILEPTEAIGAAGDQKWTQSVEIVSVDIGEDKTLITYISTYRFTNRPETINANKSGIYNFTLVSKMITKLPTKIIDSLIDGGDSVKLDVAFYPDVSSDEVLDLEIVSGATITVEELTNYYNNRNGFIEERFNIKLNRV